MSSSQSLAIEGDFRTFYTHEHYALTFTTTGVDVWAADEHGRLNHTARFAVFVQCPPYGLEPIIDPKRDLIIIADRNKASQPRIPLLLVFRLTDGKLIRKIELPGTLSEKPLQYADGKVLVAVDEEVPPDGLTTVLLYDVEGDDGRLGGVTCRSASGPASRAGSTQAGESSPYGSCRTATSSRPRPRRTTAIWSCCTTARPAF